MSLDFYQMTELNELGLTIESAHEMIEQEQEIEAVNELLKGKKRKRIARNMLE